MRYRKKARTRTHEVIHWPDTLMRSQVALRYVGHYEPLSTLSDRNRDVLDARAGGHGASRSRGLESTSEPGGILERVVFLSDICTIRAGAAINAPDDDSTLRVSKSRERLPIVCAIRRVKLSSRAAVGRAFEI